MSVNRQHIGRIGEVEARRRLVQGGYTILAANWRTRQGEIDLVARSGERIIFVEVRSRSTASSGRFGTAAESVDPRKQRQVRLLAQKYLQLTNRFDAPIRFDVIAITINADETIADYKHYEAAF